MYMKRFIIFDSMPQDGDWMRINIRRNAEAIRPHGDSRDAGMS